MGMGKLTIDDSLSSGLDHSLSKKKLNELFQPF